MHFVDERVDTGPIIIQAAVPVYDDDTEDSLSERILRQEHRIFPLAIKLFSEGKITIKDKKVIIATKKEDAVIINPPPYS